MRVFKVIVFHPPPIIPFPLLNPFHRRIKQDDDKLIAANPGHIIRWLDSGNQKCCHPFQKFIPASMPQCVVDQFQAIHIENENADSRVFADLHPYQVRLKIIAVVHPRHGIMLPEILQPFFHFLAGRNVTDRRQAAHNPVNFDRRGDNFESQAFTVPVLRDAFI